MGAGHPLQANKTMIVRQAANALEILEYFARRLRPATPAEIAEDLGWPRSSSFKLVATLAARAIFTKRERGAAITPARAGWCWTKGDRGQSRCPRQYSGWGR